MFLGIEIGVPQVACSDVSTNDRFSEAAEMPLLHCLGRIPFYRGVRDGLEICFLFQRAVVLLQAFPLLLNLLSLRLYVQGIRPCSSRVSSSL